GRKTLESIRDKYAPLYDSPLNKDWVPGVGKFYKQITGNAYSSNSAGTGVGSNEEAEKNLKDTTYQVQNSNNANTSTNNNSKVSKVIQEAKNQLGKPYKWGGNGPKSFDCSGLMVWAFKRGAGINLKRVSADQSKDSRGKLLCNINDVKAGDLVFFKNEQGKVHHVGLYIGNDQYIHAPQTGDVVKISSLSGRQKKKHDFARARRFF
ncbi:TPA: C40 family peptidase, partial [Clostridioides difficile]|nr:C40 family peptidase [Clostridioides difficile]